MEPEVELIPKIKKSELALINIGNFVSDNNRLPSVTEAESLGDFSRGLAHSAINAYIYDNEEECIRNGWIDQSRKDTIDEQFGSK